MSYLDLLKPCRIIFVSFAICISNFQLRAQDVGIDWALHFGGSLTEYFGEFDTDTAGNIYSVGLFEGTADFDPGPGTFNLVSFGIGDGYIMKLDKDANFIWAKKLGGAGDDFAFDIALDTSGNILIAGIFSNIADFDPGPGIFNMTSPSGASFFLCKLDPDGNFIWANKFGNASFTNLPYIDLDKANCIYLTGKFSIPTDFDPGSGIYNLTPVDDADIFILKFSPAGNFIWVRQIGGTLNQNSADIRVDSMGSVLVAGNFQGVTDFDPGPGVFNMTVLSSSSAYILKLDSSGNFIWACQFTGEIASCHAVYTDSDSNIYSTGVFIGVVDFDPGAGVFNLSSGPGTDAFITKMDPLGNLIWAKNFNGANVAGDDIFVDDLHNVYIAGDFDDTADFDPGIGVVNLVSMYNDAYFAKLDANGNLIWVKQISNASADGQSIELGVDDKILGAGKYQNTADFDPSAGVQNQESFGETDGFLIKLKNCSSTSSVLTETVCGSYLSPSGNSLWTISGIYTDAIGNSFGCDSIITINLTVNNPDTIVIQSGNLLSANATGATYQWLDCDNGYAPVIGETAIDFNATISGTYAVSVSENGCVDTSACFAICLPTTSIINPVACDSYISPSGNFIWNSSGTYNDVINNIHGCDSTITVNLTINNVNSIVTQSGFILVADADLAAYQWVNCDNGFQVIPGETAQTFVSGSDGSFAVIVNENGCQDTSTCFQIYGLKIPETNFGLIHVFPNPVENRLFITNTGPPELFEIYNLMGEKVIVVQLCSGTSILNISELSDGVYFYHFCGIIGKLVKD